MGEVIKTLNKKKIKLNVTAIYTSNQTRQILKNIDKKTKFSYNFNFCIEEWLTLAKIQLNNLNKCIK